MNIRASGRSALIIAAGLWVGFAGPLRATEATAAPSDQVATTEGASGPPVKLSKFTKHRSHHASRHVSHRKSAKVATKTDNAAAADKTAANAVPAPQDSAKQSPLPPAVANANAQMPGMNTIEPAAAAPPTEADALASTAGNTLAAHQNEPASQPQASAVSAEADAAANVVPSDELNDVDRALSEQQPVAPTLALASVDAPAATAPATTDASVTTGQAATSQSATNEDSAWNQTSLIGKIFIAFGGLLTLASAARMFMA